MGEKLLRVKKFFTFYVFLPVILDIVIESLIENQSFLHFLIWLTSRFYLCLMY